MDAGRVLREARRRAGLTQRDLSARANVAQSQIARIERGHTVPRVDTLDELLEACGEGLYARRRMGIGVDRLQIRATLEVRPTVRSRVAEDEAPYLARAGDRAEAPRWRPDVVLETLVRHRVRFVLIGGYAARLHGSPSVTNDTDICYARDPENLRRLAAALTELDAYLAGVPRGLPFVLDEKTLKHGMNFTFVTKAGRFDCLGQPDGIERFDELERASTELEVEGQHVSVASVSDLIRMKQAAGRPKDRIEAEVLAALQEEIDRRTEGPE